MQAATLLATMVLELRRQRINEAMASISGTFFGIFYVGWLLAHAVVLRDFDAARGEFASSLALFPGNFIARLLLHHAKID